MASPSKKVAAALAAVNAYMQEEQTIAQQRSSIETEKKRAHQGVSPWGLTGRQQMMSMRQLIQMKTFTRL